MAVPLPAEGEEPSEIVISRLREELRLARQLNRQLEERCREFAAVNARLTELVTADHLTGLKNRQHFDDVFREGFSLSTRHGLALSVVLLDLDGFKSYNDTFGHPAGDEVLCAVAAVLRKSTREHDVAARYGGEEFGVLLVGADVETATRFTERLRVSIERHPWPLRRVTASLGIATRIECTRDTTQMVHEADQALYHSKGRGRNRVTHYLDLSGGSRRMCRAVQRPQASRRTVREPEPSGRRNRTDGPVRVHGEMR
jgi:diguanylate cyclase (GGDEF)-like protein